MELSKFFLSALQDAGPLFWKRLYCQQWSTIPAFTSVAIPPDPITSQTFSSHQSSDVKLEKAADSSSEDEEEEEEDEDETLHLRLCGLPLPSSVPPTFCDGGFDFSNVDWQYYCRQHVFNRIDWESIPRDGKPSIAIKKSLTGAVYRNSARSSQYGHRPMRGVRGERVLSAAFCNSTIGYFETRINESEGDKVITVGVCSKSFPLRRKAVGWSSDAAHAALSVGFHADDGGKFAPTDPSWMGVRKWNNPIGNCRATIGCGVNFETKEVFFTRDGLFLGIAYTYAKSIPIRALADFTNSGWFPVVTMMADPADVDFNFGQRRFEFNLENTDMWSCFGRGCTSPIPSAVAELRGTAAVAWAPAPK